jgi:hypothetical protein
MSGDSAAMAAKVALTHLYQPQLAREETVVHFTVVVSSSGRSHMVPSVPGSPQVRVSSSACLRRPLTAARLRCALERGASSRERLQSWASSRGRWRTRRRERLRSPTPCVRERVVSKMRSCGCGRQLFFLTCFLRVHT